MASVRMLTPSEVAQFIDQGFVRIEGAFAPEVAAACRRILWADTGCDPGDPKTWTKPVVWLSSYSEEPFRRAANAPVLHEAFDQLVGKGRWLPPQGLGTFPVRFPADQDTGDTGWHIDVSFAGPDSDPNDFLTWRASIRSRGRALLMLFLFSDVGRDEAPTRIRVASHKIIARQLASAGDEGLPLSAFDWNATG